MQAASLSWLWSATRVGLVGPCAKNPYPWWLVLKQALCLSALVVFCSDRSKRRAQLYQIQPRLTTCASKPTARGLAHTSFTFRRRRSSSAIHPHLPSAMHLRWVFAWWEGEVFSTGAVRSTPEGDCLDGRHRIRIQSLQTTWRSVSIYSWRFRGQLLLGLASANSASRRPTHKAALGPRVIHWLISARDLVPG